jgi:glutathione peroxidase-family protein
MMKNVSRWFAAGVMLTILLLPGGALMAESFYDFIMDDIDGNPLSLKTFEGKVVLVVNVASKCGFTPQYAGLEQLFRTYKDRGFVVLGFPANNFLWQEPGTNAEIKNFCMITYNVSFPMFAKISVKGGDMAPLYSFLTSRNTSPEGSGSITWNFNKFLISRKGDAVYRFGSKTGPLDKAVVSAIEELLREAP